MRIIARRVLREFWEKYPDAEQPLRAWSHRSYLNHMESQGLTRHDLEPYIGSRARVSELLNRKRPLSLPMIRRLQKGLGISADVLVQPYELNVAS
ncbi:MAG: helix-turn-helix domain-containing protein [Chloroflexi bacterium]|nr:helix-turn-helix domain-containing protein [Chloroflexota bacterium]